MYLQRHNSSRLFIIISACLIGFVSIALTASSATAAQQPDWLKWELDTQFISGDVQTTLFVKLGYTNQNGQDIIVETSTQTLDCQIQGNQNGVQIGHGQAEFDGTGYIACDMPSIAQIKAQMKHGRDLTLYPTAYVTRADAWMNVRMIGDGITHTDPMPLFHHPDVQTYVDKSSKGKWSFILTAGSQANNMQATMRSVTPMSGANFFGLRIHQCDDPYSDYCTAVQTNNRAVTTSRILRAQDTPWENTIDATPIYFGYSPDTGEIFAGTLLDIQIDPPNRIVSG